VQYFYSHHGPVFAWGYGIALAAKLATWEEVRALDQMLAMTQTTDLAAFQTALQMRQFARWNAGYGDRDGVIYYVWNGRVYERPDGYDFTRPVPGNTSDTEWGPLVAFSELPQETNPVDDFLQNCNNAPWFVSPNTSIEEGDYPDYVIGPQTINGRGVRALDRLSEQAVWTVEELQALSFDNFSEYAAAWLPVLDYCYDEQQGAVPDPQGYLAQAMTLLRAWDYRASVDATAVHLAQEWIFTAAGVWGVIDPRDPPDPQNWTAEQQQAAVQLLLAVATAAVEDYGAVGVPWGDIHYLVRGGHTYPLPGSGPVLDSLFQADGRYNEAREIVCETGSSFQMLVELSEPVRAWTVRPISQSNDPASLHYDDITALFAQQQYKPAWFTDADVLANPDPEAPEPLTLWVP
jgi:acyl-homoserine-lactone acylase